jgi:hypothetical protein
MKSSPVARFSILLTIFAVSLNAYSQRKKHPLTILPANYGTLRLSFEPNRGQTDPSVEFLVHGSGYTLFISRNKMLLAMPGSGGHLPGRDHAAQPAVKTTAANTDDSDWLQQIRLLGSNPGAIPHLEDEQITRSNYFIGNDPAKWRTGIPNYGRVRFSSIYKGVDLIYYGNQHQLEHDFVVSPRADPAQIVFSFDGNRSGNPNAEPTIDPATGNLWISPKTGVDKRSLRLLKPLTYQEVDGKRVDIPSSYKLLPGRKVAFTIGRYNHALPLVIDPVLTYSTYLGGSGSNGFGDQGNGIAVDTAGDAYIVGTTYSADFPLTNGSFQKQNKAAAGTSTVFVSKLNPDGTALLYSTYLGGSGGDAGYGIALDPSNNAYITGATYSADFPVTCDAFQITNPSTTTGATTGFVTKLDSSGAGLYYSTYLGGQGNQASPGQGDVSQAIAVNANGNAYVTGYTYSTNFPTTTGVFQTNFKGDSANSNAFVAELSADATALVYSTYLGGGEVTVGVSGVTLSSATPPGDYGNAIALDGNGDAFVAGSTWSLDFPITSGAFQTALQGTSNAFITELNPAGSKQIYSTFLGGSGQQLFSQDFVNGTDVIMAYGDTATAVAVDSNGFAYVAGNTTSSNFPVTAGTLEGADDFDGINGTGFVAKFKQDGSGLMFSTYLEGAGTFVSSLAVDSAGNSYVAGSAPAASAGMPAGFQQTSDALPAPSSTGNSAFVVKINPTATALTTPHCWGEVPVMAQMHSRWTLSAASISPALQAHRIFPSPLARSRLRISQPSGHLRPIMPLPASWLWLRKPTQPPTPLCLPMFPPLSS